MRLFSRVLAGLGLVLVSGGVGAEPVSKQACLTAYEQAQETRQSGKFKQAKEHLKVCSNAACPALAKNDCVPWLAEVERQQPSIVVLVKGSEGEPKGATLVLDGEPMAGVGPVDVDPGEHTIKVEASGFKSATRKFKTEAGQKGQKVEVTLEADRPSVVEPPKPAPSGRSLALPLVLGGVGLAGLGVFTYFGLTGSSNEEDLKACKPFCAQSRVDDVKRQYLLADVGLGVGVLALGAGAYLLLTRPKQEGQARVTPWVGPGVGGAAVLGRF